MATATFVIKEGEHIDVHLELIPIKMNIVWCDWVWLSVELVTLKHYVSIKRHSLAMYFRKIRTFEKVENRVSKTALVIVSNVDYSLLLREELWERLPAASLEAHTSPFSK